MKKIIYFLGNCITIILSFILYGLVQQFYFYPQKLEKILHLNGAIYIFLTLALTLTALVLLFYLYRKQLARENDWGFNQSPHWDFRRGLVALLGFILLIAASAGVQWILGLNSHATSNNQTTLNQLANGAGIFYFPMIAVIAPLFEETIFRGFVFNTFFTHKTRLSKWLGIIISGFIFGYIHDPNLTKFVFVYWALGCVLAWVYTQTKDLRYSMTAHMLFNAMGFLG